MTYYYLEPMRQEDVPEVSRVDHLCFTNPWPQSAYRRELRKPQSNYYVVLRKTDGPEPPNGAPVPEERGRFGFIPLPWRSESPRRRDPIIGFAGMWIMFDEAHVTTIGVHPDERGKGLGELLLVQLFVEAAARGAQMLTLEVRVSNESAQALYRKYGFERQGVRRRYYSDNGEDAYIMWSPNIREPEYARRFEELRGQLLQRLGPKLIAAPRSGEEIEQS
ncbi:MAG TPA: ribosomal protein S18-alanine N-acetyltransferase [Thermomicrobiales bacterium]|nr:ribosomal protein S18-alanine N-acetyltransferase [Thermomicrobiales bacterium]